VLVVGGTGILRPAADALAAAGRTVSVVARGAPEPRGALHHVAADATDAGALEAALEEAVRVRGPLALVVAYAPFAPPEALGALARRARDVVLHVLPSAVAAPGAAPAEAALRAPRGPGATRALVLGWAETDDGATRWHTPAEVSGAALRALAVRGPVSVLGLLRPWARRPR
jgi:hypothetical protein